MQFFSKPKATDSQHPHIIIPRNDLPFSHIETNVTQQQKQREHSALFVIIVREIITVVREAAELEFLVCFLYEHPGDSRSTVKSSKPAGLQVSHHSCRLVCRGYRQPVVKGTLLMPAHLSCPGCFS